MLPQGCQAGHPLATEGDQRRETTSTGGAEVQVFGFESRSLLDICGENGEGVGWPGDKEVAETGSLIEKFSGTVLYIMCILRVVVAVLPLPEDGSLRN